MPLHIHSIYDTCHIRDGACVSRQPKKKANKKDSQLIIRINGEQRDQFVALCEQSDTSAAREIRAFVKQFIATHTYSFELTNGEYDEQKSIEKRAEEIA